MLRLSNAKINVGLYVTEKRADDFHNIASIFVPIPLFDAVEIIPAKKNSLHCYGLPIPGNNSKNSCLQALELMQEHFKLPNYAIHLYKSIPTGSGLGGGSSNAAEIIKMINEHQQLSLSVSNMQELALQIGSDNAFFIENNAKYVTGRGEQLANCDLNLKQCKIVLIQPTVHRSTTEAYKQVTIAKPELNLLKLKVEELISNSKKPKNAFLDSFLNTFNQGEEILNQLQNAGAFYSSLSGSGSCFYGLFTENINIPENLKNFASSHQYFYFETTIL